MLFSFSGENRLNIIRAALASVGCQMCESVGRIRKTTEGGGAGAKKKKKNTSVHSLKLYIKFTPSGLKRGLGEKSSIHLYIYFAGRLCEFSRTWRIKNRRNEGKGQTAAAVSNSVVSQRNERVWSLCGSLEKCHNNEKKEGKLDTNDSKRNVRKCLLWADRRMKEEMQKRHTDAHNPLHLWQAHCFRARC